MKRTPRTAHGEQHTDAADAPAPTADTSAAEASNATSLTGPLLRALRERAGWTRTRMAVFIARAEARAAIEGLRAEHRAQAEQNEASSTMAFRRAGAVKGMDARRQALADAVNEAAATRTERERVAADEIERAERAAEAIDSTSPHTRSILRRLAVVEATADVASTADVERATDVEASIVARYRALIGPDAFDELAATLGDQQPSNTPPRRAGRHAEE